MSATLPFNIWTKSPNCVSIYDDTFTDQLDSFQLTFVRRGTCQVVSIDIDEVKICKGQVRFTFSIDCELMAGRHDLTLTNTTEDETVFSDYPANVYDVPSDCVLNPL
jgi:hypothetical protein